MTNIQAIDLLKDLEQSLDDYCELNDEGKTAFRMAITALELFGNAEQLSSAQPGQRWIPCSERLPAYGEDVLISIGGYCNVGYVVPVNEEERYNWFFSGWYHLPNDVDAWMPPPEPYRAERRTDEKKDI